MLRPFNINWKLRKLHKVLVCLGIDVLIVLRGGIGVRAATSRIPDDMEKLLREWADHGMNGPLCMLARGVEY
jgi:hypothetical protein